MAIKCKISAKIRQTYKNQKDRNRRQPQAGQQHQTHAQKLYIAHFTCAY